MQYLERFRAQGIERGFINAVQTLNFLFLLAGFQRNGPRPDQAFCLQERADGQSALRTGLDQLQKFQNVLNSLRKRAVFVEERYAQGFGSGLIGFAYAQHFAVVFRAGECEWLGAVNCRHVATAPATVGPYPKVFPGLYALHGNQPIAAIVLLNKPYWHDRAGASDF